MTSASKLSMMKLGTRSIAFVTLTAVLFVPVGTSWASSDPDPSLPDAPTPTITTRDGGVHKVTREVTWRSLPGDFAHDQKDIWLTFPGKLATGHHWIPVLGIAGGTAALIYADPHIARYFRSHEKNIDKISDGFDPMITTAEVVALPVGLMTAGYIRKDPYQVSTALSGALAYGDSAVVDLVTKAITRRQRPSDVEAEGTFTDTFFNAGKSPFKGSSFPSGHAAAAFSVATVVANRYGNHKWVPWACYTMATLISVSRITTNAHFTSDVFLGAAYGYTVSKFQVLRPR